MKEAITLTELLVALESGRDGRRLSLDEILSVIGERGYGPLVLVLALIAMLPTGAVPGVPSICGISIALVSIQLAVGKRYPWLPQKLRDLAIDRRNYTRVAERVTPWTRRLDHLIKPRFSWLTQGIAVRVVGLACVLLGLCMIPLEIIPFAAAAPATAIALMGFGLMGQDGVWVLVGLAPAGIGLYLVLRLIG